MAELHAREAPDRVRELEAWGAALRPDGGRAGSCSATSAGTLIARLAHVGDRTRLELIRTLQDHGVHRGLDVHMEFTVVSLLSDGPRIVGALGYDRERGRFRVFKAKAVVLATGGIGGSRNHQFKELAEVDITKEPMEVGPTLHYFMGGIRVDADWQMTTVPGLFACGECAAGLHGRQPTRRQLAADLWCSASSLEHAAGLREGRTSAHCRRRAAGVSPRSTIDRRRDSSRERGRPPQGARQAVQGLMQDIFGIGRMEERCPSGVGRPRRTRSDASQVGETAIAQLDAGSRQARRGSRRSRRVRRRGHYRGWPSRRRRGAGARHVRQDFPVKDPAYATFDIMVKHRAAMQASHATIPPIRLSEAREWGSTIVPALSQGASALVYGSSRACEAGRPADLRERRSRSVYRRPRVRQARRRGESYDQSDVFRARRRRRVAGRRVQDV